MKTIYFVRHCAIDNPRNILPGRLPVILSKEGLLQAEKLHSYFLDKKVDKIYSSAVLRCKQTAETIANKNIPIAYDKRLLETFSAYQGYWFDDGNLDWDEFFNHRDELGGENYPDIQKRMVAFFTELLQKDEKDVIICSHGDPLYVLYLYLSKKELPNELDELGDGGNPLYQPKGSVRKLIVKDNNEFEFQPIEVL